VIVALLIDSPEVLTRFGSERVKRVMASIMRRAIAQWVPRERQCSHTAHPGTRHGQEKCPNRIGSSQVMIRPRGCLPRRKYAKADLSRQPATPGLVKNGGELSCEDGLGCSEVQPADPGRGEIGVSPDRRPFHIRLASDVEGNTENDHLDGRDPAAYFVELKPKQSPTMRCSSAR